MPLELSGTLASGNRFRLSESMLVVTNPEGELVREVQLDEVQSVERTGTQVTLELPGRRALSLTMESTANTSDFERHLRSSLAPQKRPTAREVERREAWSNQKIFGYSVVAIGGFLFCLYLASQIFGNSAPSSDDLEAQSVDRWNTAIATLGLSSEDYPCPPSYPDCATATSSLRSSSVAQSPAFQTVTYRVTHSQRQAEISLTYMNSQGGTEQQTTSTTNSKWERSFSMTSGSFVYLSVQNGEQSGTVTCEIYLDDHLLKKSTSSGAFVIATCDDLITW